LPIIWSAARFDRPSENHCCAGDAARLTTER
jgi:hypothetical protein